MIDTATARRVLTAALETGGDFAELYMEDTESNALSLIDQRIENATYARNRGAGVRVLSGVRSAYAYTADISEEALIATARAAAAAVAGNGMPEAAAFAMKDYRRSPQIAFSTVDNAARIALVKRGFAAARDYSPEITQISARVLDEDQRVLICNSEGVFAQDRRPRARFVISAVATKDAEAQTGSQGPGLGLGFEAFERIDVEAAGREAARQAVTMLHAPQCPAGYLPVVIGGGFGGVIFHEACGHSLEATAVSKGNSEFCGKLGQRIADERVTAIDDGTLAGEWGSIMIDDEGTPSRRNVLIEKGILKGYLIDRLGGRRMGMPVTGSSRREGYAYAPTSRMTNIFIAPGEDDEEDRLRSMAEGLYAKSMGGGSVNPLTGEFNFAVDEGYWVKNGAIVTPVRGATLGGKGSEILMKIDRVGKTLSMGQGMCGSVSGSVPTNAGPPHIRVSAITIGGKGGTL